MKKFLCMFLCLWMLCLTGVTALAADEQPYAPVSGIQLNTAMVSMVYGGTAQLTATVLPADATNKSVTWSSSNPDLVQVDQNGKLTAAKDTAETPSGKKNVTITVKSVQNPSATAQCVVTVDNDSATKISQAFKQILTMVKTLFSALQTAFGGTAKQFLEAFTDFVKKLIEAVPKTA